MKPQEPTSSAAARRVFFAAGDEPFQLFSTSQNANDGSIYFSAPSFEDIAWLVPALVDDHTPILLSYKSDGPGKLSLHGSGVTHVRPHAFPSRNKFAVHGNFLKAAHGESLGVRHLLTLFPPQPVHRPASPAMARKSDYVLTSKELHPYVLIFWAVPAFRPLTVTVSSQFNADELKEVPPNGGWGSFNLLLHAVVWFAYRTKYMDKWPRNAQACYQDGYTVPLLIGTGEGTFRLEFRRPVVTLTETHLAIAL